MHLELITVPNGHIISQDKDKTIGLYQFQFITGFCFTASDLRVIAITFYICIYPK